MRVLHLDAGRVMRGGQLQVLRLIAGLLAAGVDCTLLARQGSPLFAEASRRGWRVESLGILRARRLAREHDLVHAHDARSHTIGALVPGVPLIVARRVAFPVRSRWKYARTRCCIAVSQFVKSVLIAGGVPEGKIVVVYDGVPLLEPAHGTTVLALANADDPQKGASIAVAAAQVAGVPLKLTANLEHDIREARLFLYISHSEGLGSAALLAMSAGVPVVASDRGGLREAITHRENGLLVENSPEAVARAIRELSDDPGLAARLGRAARRSVAERFTTELMVRRTLEMYPRVMS